MNVQVVPHRGKDAATKREQYTGQYAIMIDGKLGGFIGEHDGARPMVIRRYSPLELKEIEDAVRRQLADTQKIGGIRQPTNKKMPEPKKPDMRSILE